MDLGQHSRTFSVSSACSKRQLLRKLRKSIMAVVQVVRLLKSMRRLCLLPAAAAVEPEPINTSTGPRKEQESLPYPCRYSENPHLKLKFSNNIRGPIFTGLPVGGEGSTLNLDLVDPLTENIINCGPEASAKVELLVLEKEFKQGYYGTPEEFNSRIVRGCDEKSLIRGDPHVTLKDGTVSVSHISFKHTNAPMKKRELRLGARAVYSYCGTRIMEAVTEPFFVKDRRSMGKSLRPLTLDDEVWKLQTIGKRGGFHDRLKKESIKTVRDFLTQYFLHREKLVNILGKRMQRKKLDAAVNQAKSKLDLKRYLLYPSANSHVSVVFTDVGEVIGVYQEDHQFVSIENLTAIQKASALDLVKIAFQNGQNANCPLLEATVDVDGSNDGFSLEDHCPIDHQGLINANSMPSTSIIAENNYESINQINGSLAADPPPYDNDFIYQPHYHSVWDLLDN